MERERGGSVDHAPNRPRAFETVREKWKRRALTFSALGVASGVYAISSPLIISAALGGDVLRRRARLPWTRAALFGGLYLGAEAIGLLLAGVIPPITGLLPARRRAKARLDLNAALQRAWSGTLFRGLRSIFGLQIEVEGAEAAECGPFVLMVRHSSAADTLLASALIANPHRIVLRYVLKKELLWDPCLDVVGQRLPNAFVARGASGSSAEAQIEALRGLARGLDEHSAVLIYPEGTRFSPAKRKRAVEALRESGRPDLAARAERLRAVLPIRLKGALALLEEAEGCDVLFLEHVGLDGALGWRELLRGDLIGRRIAVRLRRFSAEQIPQSERDVWLLDRWDEVDRWVLDRCEEMRPVKEPRGEVARAAIQ